MPSGLLKDYIGYGPIADRPATPDLSPGTLGFWWADDEEKLYAYDGAWTEVSGGGGGGVPEAPNDGSYYARRNEGWSAFTPGGGGGGGLGPVPDLADFTWYNQGAVTAYEASGEFITMTTGAADGDNHLLYYPCPAYEHRIVMRLEQQGVFTYNNNSWMLVGWFDDATNKYHTLDRRFNMADNKCIIEGWTGPSAWGGVQGREWNPAWPFGPMYYGLRQDATDIYFEVSLDGVNFTTYNQQAKSGAYLGSGGYTNVTFGVLANYGTDFAQVRLSFMEVQDLS